MQPKFFLPIVSDEHPHGKEFNPKQVSEWLRRRPASDLLYRARELTGYLAAANQGQMPTEARATWLKAIEADVQDTVAALRKRYRDASLPLAPTLCPYAKEAQKLLLTLAVAYKLLIISWAKHAMHANTQLLAKNLHQLFACLQQALGISYETHTEVPEGVWLDLHQTYHYARHTGLARILPETSIDHVSIEALYVSTLLLAIADPYRLSPLELTWVRDIINRYGHLCKIVVAGATSEHAGTYVIAMNSDAPPAPLVRQRHPNQGHWDFLLDTTDLVKHLLFLQTQIRARIEPEKLGLPTAAKTAGYGMMLRRLCLNWGASIQRRAQRRRAKSEKEIDVVFGFDTVYRLVASGAPKDAVESQAAERAPVLRCTIIDDSMSGIALGFTGNTNVQVSVGDAVGVRLDDRRWGIGLLRWFRLSAACELLFGVQLLAPSAMPIRLSLEGTGKEGVGLLLAQLVPTVRATKLLTPNGFLVPGTTTKAASEAGPLAIRVEKWLESTTRVDLFRVLVGE